MRKLSVVFLFLLTSVSSSNAANWYVKKGATGTNAGTSWANAWNEMDQISWRSISPGDTIWLAGGTYTSNLTIGKSGTSDNRIYVKRVRATDADPTAAAGWNASYDAQVIINVDDGIRWNSGTDGTGSYVTIDGRIDSGIRSVTPGLYSWSAAVFMDTGNTGVVIQYVDAAGPGGADPYMYVEDVKAIKTAWGSGRGTVTDLTVRYCRMHGAVDQLMLSNISTGLFEHNELYDNRSLNAAKFHPGTVGVTSCGGTITYRYNKHYNLTAEGILLGTSAGSSPCTWKVYGNIFYGGYNDLYRFIELQYKDWPVYVYNNTIVDLWVGIRAINGATWATGSQVYNNIFYNVAIPYAEGTTVVHDYNALSGSNSEAHGVANMRSSAFVNYAGRDYRIISGVGANYPADKGVSLGAEYGTDILGVSRPQNSAWDIGAYESTGLPYIISTLPMPPNIVQIR